MLWDREGGQGKPKYVRQLTGFHRARVGEREERIPVGVAETGIAAKSRASPSVDPDSNTRTSQM